MNPRRGRINPPRAAINPNSPNKRFQRVLGGVQCGQQKDQSLLSTRGAATARAIIRAGLGEFVSAMSHSVANIIDLQPYFV
jgi:hypothetical protein